MVMVDEDNFAASPIRWGLMLDYERNDVLLQLCRQLSFFRTDNLKLSEREEVLCSSGTEANTMEHLIIHGSVGNTRREAFLRLLRLARLTLVQDIASHVVVSPQIGDVLPNSMLYPLWESHQVTSLRKWNNIFWAMQCGLLKKIKRRRDMVQMHVEQILAAKLTQENINSGSEGEKVNNEQEKYFYNTFRDLFDLEQGERHAPLERYHIAIGEDRVSLSTAIASLPTLIVVWASWDSASIEWLKEHLFTINKVNKMDNLDVPGQKNSIDLDDDPWLQAVMQFVQVLRRPILTKRRRFPAYVRRSKIILVSVDREKIAALHTLDSLFAGLGGWKSAEVSLLSLWCGADGLQSSFATDLNIATLPFFIATKLPEKSIKGLGGGRFPRIHYITPCTEGEICSELPMGNNAHLDASQTGTALVDWHSILKEERMQVASVISRFLVSSDAPLRFVSRVDHTYQVPYFSTLPSTQALKPVISSFVSLSGTVSTPDMQKMKEAINILLRVKNFFWELRVMKPSSPLRTQLNPYTPTQYILGRTRNISCSECLLNIFIDKEHHFRCVHCDQMDGVVCRRCFLDSSHPRSHVLLFVPAGAETTLQLLWGPSNVLPLSHFCGAFLTNTDDTHIGVYCNNCLQLLRGVRWKCAMCYQYDMCDQCFEKKNCFKFFKYDKTYSLFQGPTQDSRAGILSSNKHAESHMFLCIRHGCGADADECLRPVMEKDSLPSLLGWKNSANIL